MRIIRTLPVFIAILVKLLIAADIKEMSGYDYLNKNLRLFKETSRVQQEWISLNDEFVAVDSITKPVDWGKMNSKAKTLLSDFQVYYQHFGEDIERISKELKEEDLTKLGPFINQAVAYVDVFDKTVIKLCKIVDNLYNLTLNPESLTFKDHKQEMDDYRLLSDEYSVEGGELNDEYEKTKRIVISVVDY